MSDATDGLRKALELDPDNHALRLMLADLLRPTDPEGALAAFKHVLEAGALGHDRAVEVGRLALNAVDLPTVEACLSLAQSAGIVDGVGDLARDFASAKDASGVLKLVPAQSEDAGPSELMAAETTTFADVGGLSAVKKIIHRKVILPLTRPALLAKYKKKSGGGVLLYGPPGCGKTLMARATAGECDLPFFVLRIEDVLSQYMGGAERNLHHAFERAREHAPCVLFIDELDAIGFARSRMTNSSARTLVDQLLQELDAMGADNTGVLILAATNAPWDLDDAIQRPGRFDRLVFVPPPDTEARREIVALHLSDRPHADVDVEVLAKATERFSGADLHNLVEQAYDLVIEEALLTGKEPPATMAHFREALRDMRPSTGDWLRRAQNHVEFANTDDRYSDIADYLGTPKKRWGLF